MNLLLVARPEIDPRGRVRLSDRRAEHLCKVLGAEVGQGVKVGVIDGGRGVAEVLEVGPSAIVLEIPPGIVEGGAAPVDLLPEVDVILALPRPQALHRVLQTIATMSVRRLDLVRSWRVEKSFFASPSVSPPSIEKHLWLGAEQGAVTRLPEVHVHPQFRPFIESLTLETASPPSPSQRGETETTTHGDLRLIAHPGVPTAIEEAVATRPGVGRVLLAIGPEGGWIDRELESFADVGFQGVHLGPWILKVENALTAALAQLELAKRLAETLSRAKATADTVTV